VPGPRNARLPGGLGWEVACLALTGEPTASSAAARAQVATGLNLYERFQRPGAVPDTRLASPPANVAAGRDGQQAEGPAWRGHGRCRLPVETPTRPYIYKNVRF
jgi:hypothetical protein